MESVAQVAVLGAGYWGKNLVRNFHELGALRWICDPRAEALEEISAKYDALTTSSLDPILSDARTRAVVIAAPAAQHYELARKCLRAGKDVYSEKPLALHASEGKELVRIAAEAKRILMVGHILEYHPAILMLKKLIREGELGCIRYIYSSRLNLGKLRTEENILWSFAPHDISAILHLLGEMPDRISSSGGSYLNHNIDTTLTTCDFPSGVKAHIFVSWLHPFKEQKLAIIGDKKMAVFDDMEKDRKLVLYSHKIEWMDRVPVAKKDEGHVVPLSVVEPLRLECEHFLECIDKRVSPRTDGESALRVLQVLEGCEQSLREKQAVSLGTNKPDYFAHASAVVDEGAQIGEGTRIWHFSHIMSGSKVGKRCNLGQNVVISPGVEIGNNVKIQNNVSVYSGVVLEDDVFCGPSMVFTNVINPRSHIERKHEYKKTHVGKGASIGANATVVCGVTLGKYAFVAAGAVVTKDVPDYALVAGVPARRIGWMCYCGIRIANHGNETCCEECGRKYVIADGVCAAVQPEVAIPETVIEAAA